MTGSLLLLEGGMLTACDGNTTHRSKLDITPAISYNRYWFTLLQFTERDGHEGVVASFCCCAAGQ